MEGRCKKHSSHKQSKGVCPYCLRERLAQLTASSASSTTTNPSSSSAAYSSFDSNNASSSTASPGPNHRSKKALLHLLKGTTEPLRRSRSLAFPAGEGKDKNEIMEQKKQQKQNKKKQSNRRSGSMIWSKFLLVGAGRIKEGGEGNMYHSKTIKEKPSTKWSFFS